MVLNRSKPSFDEVKRLLENQANFLKIPVMKYKLTSEEQSGLKVYLDSITRDIFEEHTEDFFTMFRSIFDTIPIANLNNSQIGRDVFDIVPSRGDVTRRMCKLFLENGQLSNLNSKRCISFLRTILHINATTMQDLLVGSRILFNKSSKPYELMNENVDILTCQMAQDFLKFHYYPLSIMMKIERKCDDLEETAKIYGKQYEVVDYASSVGLFSMFHLCNTDKLISFIKKVYIEGITLRDLEESCDSIKIITKYIMSPQDEHEESVFIKFLDAGVIFQDNMTKFLSHSSTFWREASFNAINQFFVENNMRSYSVDLTRKTEYLNRIFTVLGQHESNEEEAKEQFVSANLICETISNEISTTPFISFESVNEEDVESVHDCPRVSESCTEASPGANSRLFRRFELSEGSSFTIKSKRRLSKKRKRTAFSEDEDNEILVHGPISSKRRPRLNSSDKDLPTSSLNKDDKDNNRELLGEDHFRTTSNIHTPRSTDKCVTNENVPYELKNLTFMQEAGNILRYVSSEIPNSTTISIVNKENNINIKYVGQIDDKQTIIVINKESDDGNTMLISSHSGLLQSHQVSLSRPYTSDRVSRDLIPYEIPSEMFSVTKPNGLPRIRCNEMWVHPAFNPVPYDRTIQSNRAVYTLRPSNLASRIGIHTNLSSRRYDDDDLKIYAILNFLKNQNSSMHNCYEELIKKKYTTTDNQAYKENFNKFVRTTVLKMGGKNWSKERLIEISEKVIKILHDFSGLPTFRHTGKTITRNYLKRKESYNKEIDEMIDSDRDIEND
uniref:Uncharacterized protein n=1 Tax=Strongyloides papillosus TaxID=174720 RepID=A0A0N5CH92_STREA